MSRHKDSCGQAFVLTIMFLLVLMGMATAVLDVGSWYRAHRALQATVDAAALAGAQALPGDSGEASALANLYATKNGGGSMTITFSAGVVPDDTINVEGTRPAPGFFAKVFGVDSITVRTHAKARAGYPTAAKWVAPIVVNVNHDMLKNCPSDPPCKNDTSLEYYHLKNKGAQNDGAGSFGFINLTGDNGVGSNELGEWISEGFDQLLEVNQDYLVSTGNPFSSSNIKGALEEKVEEGDTLLFPVYDKLTGTGNNAKYHIVGFAAFVITSMDLTGNNETFYGHFVNVTWEAVQATKASEIPPDFGVTNVSLID
jgi:Putative Flp pilus-assembly TadE/G-like